jgi:uncharacterized protein (DUF2267 family)
MDDTSLLAEVELMSGLGRPEAKRAVRATLETLAELLGPTERKALAAELPPGCGRHVRAPAEAPAQLGLDEFLRRVAQREHVDGRTARTHAIAVFAALGAAISNDLLHRMAEQLPKQYRGLFAVAAASERNEREAALDPLVLRVAELANLDEHLALRATEAVLETLGARISPTEVHDLMPELPVRLTPALERGLHESWQPRPLSRDEFVHWVAEREGVSDSRALQDVRAVFRAIYESVPGAEFSQIAQRLGEDYEPFLVDVR